MACGPAEGPSPPDEVLRWQGLFVSRSVRLQVRCPRRHPSILRRAPMNRQLLSILVSSVLPLAATPAQNLVRDLTPASASTVGGNPSTAVICNGVAYFTASDQYGRELWRTDGTDLGT